MQLRNVQGSPFVVPSKTEATGTRGERRKRLALGARGGSDCHKPWCVADTATPEPWVKR